jgi:hypothetical protein
LFRSRSPAYPVEVLRPSQLGGTSSSGERSPNKRLMGSRLPAPPAPSPTRQTACVGSGAFFSIDTTSAFPATLPTYAAARRSANERAHGADLRRHALLALEEDSTLDPLPRRPARPRPRHMCLARIRLPHVGQNPLDHRRCEGLGAAHGRRDSARRTDPVLTLQCTREVSSPSL